VYWTNLNPSALMRVPITGGAAVTLASGLVNMPVALYQASVYWGDGTGLMRAALDGSSAVALMPNPGISALVVDGTGIYWASPTDAANPRCTGAVAVTPLDGGTPTTLASSVCNWPWGGVAVDGTSIYIDQSTPSPAVVKAPLAGGPWVSLAPVQLLAGGLAVDHTSAYWADYSAGLVWRVGLDGGTPQTLASAQASPAHVAVDATAVYWMNVANPDFAPGTLGSVVKLTLLAGCAPVTLASGLQPDYGIGARGIAIDSTSVYWRSYSDGKVMKTSK
jgi:hypothetical protein